MLCGGGQGWRCIIDPDLIVKAPVTTRVNLDLLVPFTLSIFIGKHPPSSVSCPVCLAPPAVACFQSPVPLDPLILSLCPTFLYIRFFRSMAALGLTLSLVSACRVWTICVLVLLAFRRSPALHPLSRSRCAPVCLTPFQKRGSLSPDYLHLVKLATG